MSKLTEALASDPEFRQAIVDAAESEATDLKDSDDDEDKEKGEALSQLATQLKADQAQITDEQEQLVVDILRESIIDP
jgi:hypothetical protein